MDCFASLAMTIPTLVLLRPRARRRSCAARYIAVRRRRRRNRLHRDAARTVNLAEWSSHLLERLHRQCESTADPELIKLYHELKAYPIPARSAPLSADNVAIPFKMRLDGDVLSFIPPR